MRDLTDRQREVYDFIIAFGEEQGYPPTLQEIAAHLGISGNLGVLRHLTALEKKGYIRRNAGASRGIAPVSPKSATVSLPVVGAVRAGVPHPAVEDIRGHVAVDASLVKAKDAFILKVEGDSMIDAHITPGDLAIVKPQPTARNGEIVVAMIDGEATLKRFFREGDRIRLQPENARMEPIFVGPEGGEVFIVGKVIGLWRAME